MKSAASFAPGAVVCALSLAWIATGCTAARTADLASEPRAVAPARPAPPAKVVAERAAQRPAQVPVPDAPSPAPVAAPALRGPVAPVWSVGDQWAFRWESADGQGEYVWTVDRLDTRDGVDQYVVRSGTREIFFRRSDLATSLETAAGRVERRNSPPRLAFSWPLTEGTTWRQRYMEESGGRAGAERSIEWKVEGQDRVRVGAGEFDAFRVVARHAPTPAIMYEMWYAPEVKQWVRLKEHFPAGIRYRELTAFSLRS